MSDDLVVVWTKLWVKRKDAKQASELLRDAVVDQDLLCVEQVQSGVDDPRELTRLKAQVHEALAVLENGSDYEKLHVAEILKNGL